MCIRDSSRVILHVSSGSPRDALAVLEHAEGILETARSAGRTVSVEIVANSGGLDLLREGVSAHAGRIAGLRACLLYTSDAADERSRVDLGGSRIIKKKKEHHCGSSQAVTTENDTNTDITRKDTTNNYTEI